MDRSRRVNGLEYPYTPTQLSTWVYLPTLVIQFMLFASPILPMAASIPISIIFFITAIGSAYNAYQAMYIDPADPRLPFDHEHGDGDGEMNMNDNNNDNACAWDPNEPTKQCWLCDVQVGEKSMHCKFCNKCVDQFDHHCMWLNTCVGKANYKYFFRTMVWITIMLTIHGSVQLALVLDIYLGNGSTRKRSEDWLGTTGSDTTLIVVIFMCVFVLMDVVALSLILQLLSFHLRLQREGLSTYGYIVRDNKRKREQAQKDSLIEQKRQLAMSKAQEEGRTKDYMQLRYGGLLRRHCGMNCCDPMIKEEREREQQEEKRQEQQMRIDASTTAEAAENKRSSSSDNNENNYISNDDDDDDVDVENNNHQNHQNGHTTNNVMNGGNNDGDNNFGQISSVTGDIAVEESKEPEEYT